MSRSPFRPGVDVVLVTLSLGAALAVPRAQTQTPQQPSFTAGNRTVAVYATVTNAQQRLVTNLKRDEFAIDDNGKHQELTLFSNDIQPITLIMLLDRSSSMKPNFDLEQQAAQSFVRSMGLEDKARIGSFSRYIQIDPPDFTSNREELLKILKNDLQGEGPTPLWNAVDRGIDKLLLEQGRRVILVFTDGVDRPMDFSGQHKSLKDVMKRAEEHDVMVYAIGFSGENGSPGGAPAPTDRRNGGRPEILIMPNLEAGNMLYKQLVYLAHAECAGIVLGTRVPIVLTSRADSAESRVASCALAVLHARRNS